MTELVPAPGWTVLTVPPGAGYRPLDEDEIRRVCGVLLDPAHAVSLMRLPGGSRRVVPALADRVIEAARAMSEGAIGVYASVAPVSPTLDHPMRVGDALSRPWLDIDIDPERPDDVMATEGEHALALGMGRDIHEGLCELGWPAPVLIDSGSGCRLLYRINLPNDRDTRDLILRCLKRIFAYWKRDGIVEDHGSASAITHCKIPGTWARKGPDTPDRPHRMVRLIHAPACVEVVSRELLEELAGPAVERPAAPLAWSLRVPGAGTERYGQTALDREVQRVLMARAGDREQGRNITLNRAAFSVFQLVAGGVIEDGLAYSELLSAGIRVGLPERDVRSVLDRARRDAASSPRGVPDRPAVAAPSANGKHEPTTKGDPKQRTPPAILCMQDLLGMELPPARWVVPGLLSEGLTILAGKPKLGKSWLALNLALTVAAGGKVLGQHEAVAGAVLYLSLEDRLRRVQDRTRKILQGVQIPVGRNLFVAVEWLRMDGGGLDDIAGWIDRTESPTLVIIDVWQKFRPPARGSGQSYEQDYQAISALKQMLDDKRVSGLIVHHCKKARAEDALEEVSGTNGLAGGADGVCVLTRARHENEGILFVTGRDVEEQKLALSFDPKTFVWTSLGDAEARVQSKIGKQLIEALRASGPGVYHWPKGLAEMLQIDPAVCRVQLHRLADRGILMRDGGRYCWPTDPISEPPGADARAF